MATAQINRVGGKGRSRGTATRRNVAGKSASGMSPGAEARSKASAMYLFDTGYYKPQHKSFIRGIAITRDSRLTNPRAKWNAATVVGYRIAGNKGIFGLAPLNRVMFGRGWSPGRGQANKARKELAAGGYKVSKITGTIKLNRIGVAAVRRGQVVDGRKLNTSPRKNKPAFKPSGMKGGSKGGGGGNRGRRTRRDSRGRYNGSY